MTIRRGVIAALACLFAGLAKRLPGQQEEFPGLGNDVEIESHIPTALFSLNLQTGHSMHHGCVLEVRCGERVVRLTADEIMDALEGDTK